MIKDRELKKRLYNLCTLDALDADDPRNINIDEAFPGARGHRPWVRRIATMLEMADTPQCVLVSGLPGSGKSTELRRLKARLEADGSSYFVPIVQAENWIDLSLPLSEAELFSMMLYQVEQQLLALEGSKASPMRDGPFARFWHWVNNTEVTLTGLKSVAKTSGKLKEPITGSEATVEAGVEVQLELKTDPRLRALVRDRLKHSPGEFIRQVDETFREQIVRARKFRPAGLIVLVDSLEKLRGTTNTADEVVASVEQLFRADGHVTRLPMHVVFTVPPTQIVRAPTRTHFIPLVQVTDRDGKPCDAGVNAGIALVRARLDEAALNEILGATTREEYLRQIVIQTGGYPRALLRLLRELIATDDRRTDRVIQQILNEEANVFNLGLPVSCYPWLAKVATTHDLGLLANTPEAMRDRDMALISEVVLWYHNDTAWFDLVPIVKKLPSVVHAIERATSLAKAETA